MVLQWIDKSFGASATGLALTSTVTNAGALSALSSPTRNEKRRVVMSSIGEGAQ